ncbi:MAG: SH3 domain-containing protein [Zoogloeaceae bacterium]|jgi:SH3-like domain-containing protein|nr:SH3 domain-containing protein [Zoogloeaceae bacterium]
MLRFLSIIALFVAAFWSSLVGAQEYRSVSAVAAILYDAPSVQGKKLYLVKTGTPLEVLVQVEGWTKVRDAEGGIAWIVNPALTTQRMVVVTADQAEVRQAANEEAALVFQAVKWVALELQEGAPAGWAKVRHKDGVSGFVRIMQVWGL